MTSSETDLLALEYQEINAHLRTNTTAFVNWFSFFLTFSLVAAIAFLVTGEHRQGLRGTRAAIWCANRLPDAARYSPRRHLDLPALRHRRTSQA